MTIMLAVALWVLHGMILWWNWGQFRPHIALLHGVAMGLLAGGLAWVGAPVWLVYGLAALVGGVGGWGHRLAPGLWVGNALLLAVPFLTPSAESLAAAGAFALVSQGAAALASLTRSSL